MGQFSSNNLFKNIGFAIAMMLFLAISFKLTGDLNADTTPAISQTDSVISTLNTPNK